MAIVGHPPDQTAPGQTQGAPKAAHRGKLPPQLRQADRRQGKCRTPIRPNDARAIAGHPPRQAPARGNSRHNSARQTGTKASARRSLDQAAPRQAQDTLRGKHPPGETPATTPPSRQVPRQAQGARYTKQCQGNRRTPIRTSNAEASTRRANPSDQAVPGIQTEIASLNGDRRFQLQRSGAISSGPLKKLRVSCVHERDGKQVPCVRSLCSYARESRAC